MRKNEPLMTLMTLMAQMGSIDSSGLKNLCYQCHLWF